MGPLVRCGGFDPCHLVWVIILAGGALLSTFGFLSGDWIHPNDNPLDVKCGPYVACVGDTCEKYDPQENKTWEAAMWLMVVGLGLVWLAVLGALVTMWLQEWQPVSHNISMFGSVLALIGLICFAFGFDNTRISRTQYAPCNFCGEKTDVTQLEECTLGAGIIMMIVGVVVLFIAGILGWTVNHRADAPEAYRERTYTGRRKASTNNFRKPTQPAAAPGAGGNDKWQKNTTNNQAF